PPSSTLFPYTTLFRSNDTDRQSETLGFFEPGLGVVGSPLSANVGTDHDGACAPCDFAFDLVVRSQSPSPSSSPISAVRSTGAARSEEHTSELQSRENL